MNSSAAKLAAAVVLLAAYVPQVDALCRCTCGNRSGSIYSSCSVYSCQNAFGTCPVGWRAYNQNGSIIGGTLGGFFFLLTGLLCCLMLLRRRRRARKAGFVQEIRIPNNGGGQGPFYAGNSEQTYPPQSHQPQYAQQSYGQQQYPPPQQGYAPPPGPPPPTYGK
ncbi:hypothetical protein DFJ77DRAFT_450615 [Powellomyces hirtus]|nr:hypothetical protein DFJ77DRAFT_450615 [Powellomyces hirtus]